ncbi:MAG: Uncharacterised protein [SAR116 cluster bacterium]|nr:MAG: Uncharacterised protein [SAR116 cluster bacterium]
MDMAANSPQKPLCRREPSRLALAQDALFHQRDDAVCTVGKFGNPEQCMEVAKPALALLDIGLNNITRVAMPLVSRVTFTQLEGCKLGRLYAPCLASKGAPEIAPYALVSLNQAHFEKACENGVVLTRSAHCCRNGAFGMANLQPQIPQQIQHLLDNYIRSAGAVFFRQKQKVDIRIWCQLPAPIPPDSNQRHIFSPIAGA